MSNDALSPREKDIKYPDASVLGQQLRRSAERFPNRIALKFEDQEFTYKDYNARVNRAANGLIKLGVNKGDKVALLGYNSAVWIEACSAVFKSGGVLIPVNFRLVGHEVEYIVNFSDSVALIIDECLLGTIAEVRPNLKAKNIIVMRGAAPEGMVAYDDICQSGSEEEPDVKILETDVAVMAQTSGTTGRPKFVIHTHRSASEVLRNVAFSHNYREEDRALMALPVYSSAGFGYDYGPTFWHGGTLVVMPLPPFNPVAVLEIVQKEKINRLVLAPIMIDAILYFVPDEVKQNFDISSIKTVISVGAPTEAHTREAAVKFFGDVLYTDYSASELGLGTVLKPHEVLKYSKSSGRTAIGMELKIVDDHGHEMPQGEVGEIVAGGTMVSLGYFKNPEATKDALYGRYMGLGDMGYIDEEGYVYVVDRKSDMIVSGGLNIYPAEIEAVMINHPAIAEVAVIAVPDDKWGQSVKALVIKAPGDETSGEEIIEWCKSNMAGYRVPKSVDFATEFPKTPTGKVQKKILREPYWEGYDRKI